jgi:hypothetical protein
MDGKRPKNTHIFDKEEYDCYVEPHWCSVRLFEAEQFPGLVHDPFCGTGRVVSAARAAGYDVRATDIVDYGYAGLDEVKDFLTIDNIGPDTSLVSNPPFEDEILQHVIDLDPIKAAMIWPLARLVAAGEWLSRAPLAHIWMLTPRPPMPPLSYIQAGFKPEGGRVEHCWLVFARGHHKLRTIGWLPRDPEYIPDARGVVSRIHGGES